MIGVACGTTGLYLCWVAHNRFKYRDSLEHAVFPADAVKIYQETTLREFPFLSTKALEFGLFKTYAIPSISKILASTKELVDRTGRRYDDTDLIMREITENDIDSDRAIEALRRLNHLHSKYPISNDDYKYVLSIFIVEPSRWIDRFGYRTMHPKEKEVVRSLSPIATIQHTVRQPEI